MRTVLLSLILMMVACADVPGDGAADPVPDAVEIAMARNPDVAIAASRIIAARAGVSEVRAAWYPRFDLSLGYVHTNDPVLVFMSTLRQRDLSYGGNFNRPGDRGNLRTSAELSRLARDGGRRGAGEDLARIGVRLEEAGREAVLNELKSAVLQTCLAVFEAEEFIHVGEESLDLVNQQLGIARTRSAGSSTCRASSTTRRSAPRPRCAPRSRRGTVRSRRTTRVSPRIMGTILSISSPRVRRCLRRRSWSSSTTMR